MRKGLLVEQRKDGGKGLFCVPEPSHQLWALEDAQRTWT